MKRVAPAVAIIPARLGSTRLPNKVLLSETGKPLVQHVVEAASRARGVDRVVVAADDERIVEALAPFGTTTLLTGTEHANGTSRLEEAVRLLGLGEDAVVINVQGDEPEVEPEVIDAAIGALTSAGSEIGMSTVGSPFAAGEDPADPNIVKVVRSADGRALYFSRSPIPFDRDGDAATRLPCGTRDGLGWSGPLKHVGLYCYRAWMLRRYVTLDPTPLEQVERLEQLRVLEHGLPIAVAIAATERHGIDTRAQYAAFVGRQRGGDAASRPSGD